MVQRPITTALVRNGDQSSAHSVEHILSLGIFPSQDGSTIGKQKIYVYCVKHILPASVSDICNFYTSVFQSLKILHPKVRKLAKMTRCTTR